MLTGGTPGAFDPTGRTLAEIGPGGSIQFRDVNLAQAVADVCRATPRQN